MDDHLVEAALLDGAFQQREVGVMEWIEGAEEQADAALRRNLGADIRRKPDTEQHGAETEAHDQEGLASIGQACRPQRRQHEVDGQAGLHIAIDVAHAALREVDPEILDALRGKRGDKRRRRNTAGGRTLGCLAARLAEPFLQPV